MNTIVREAENRAEDSILNFLTPLSLCLFSTQAPFSAIKLVMRFLDLQDIVKK